METLFEGLEITDKNDEDLPGFAWFWKNFPKDPMRPHKKSGKTYCRRKWKIHRLESRLDMVKSAIKEDIKNIKKGAFAFSQDSRDKMCYFPGVKPWINDFKWDRDVEPEPEANPVVVEPPVVHNVMTAEEKARMLPAWRELARGKARPWPRTPL